MSSTAVLHINGTHYELDDGVTSAEEAQQLYGARVRNLVGGQGIAGATKIPLPEHFSVRLDGVRTTLTVAPLLVWAAAVTFHETGAPGQVSIG